MGFYFGDIPNPASVEHKRYREASPIFQVTPDDAPMLLIHGDKDDRVPLEHSHMMAAKLKEAGVTVKLVTVPGGVHGPNFGLYPVGTRPGADQIDHAVEAIRWFEQHLTSGVRQ